MLKRLVICLVLLALAGCTDRGPYEEVRAAAAFVYAGGGQAVLVLASGEYIAPNPLVDGCYRLYKPVDGSALGTVQWVSAHCE